MLNVILKKITYKYYFSNIFSTKQRGKWQIQYLIKEPLKRLDHVTLVFFKIFKIFTFYDS